MITWSDSTGVTGTLTEEVSETLTDGHFMVEYPFIVDNKNDNKLKITMKDQHITENPYTVTVTITFYASIKPNKLNNLLKDTPLANTMYFNIDAADINTAALAEMEPEIIQKFNLSILGKPLNFPLLKAPFIFLAKVNYLIFLTPLQKLIFQTLMLKLP